VVVAAKTAEANPKLPGTIFTAPGRSNGGGKGPPLQVDIRFEEQLAAAAAKAAETFGGVDILVNNASAISLTGTLQTDEAVRPHVRVNVRGTFAASQALLPYLLKAKNPTSSPEPSPFPESEMVRDPLRLHDGEVRDEHVRPRHGGGVPEAGVAVNALWPRTVIATAALAMIPGIEVKNCRRPEIVADAAHAILTRDSRACTGNFFLDDEVLASEGVTDLSRYAVEPGAPLLPDLFLG